MKPKFLDAALTPILSVAATLLLGATIEAQISFTTRASFLTAGNGGAALTEDFDGYGNGAAVGSAFGGLATLSSGGTLSPTPTAFFGTWGTGCGPLLFAGNGAIPEPRFQSRSLVVTLAHPVFGLGGEVCDDADGVPRVSVITLTVWDSIGNRWQVSEDCNSVGDVGFLGFTCPSGIVRAEFSIASTGGNLEVDLLTVLDWHLASTTAFGTACNSSLGPVTLSPLGSSTPRLGGTLQLATTNVPGPGLLIVGASNTAYGSVPLPFDLAGLGAPGCSLLVAPDWSTFGGGVAGTMNSSLPIPSNLSLLGLRVFVQSAALDSAANPLGLATSNGLVAVLGH